MTSLPPTPENIELAKRVIWFEPPEQALAQPSRFLAYAFRFANRDDMDVIRRHYSADDLSNALQNAPPGIIDPRSWSYWNLILRDLSPPPPMPTRTFD